MKTFKKLLEISRYPLSYWQGMKFYRNRDWRNASIYFQKAIDISPKHPQSNFKLGMCYFKQRNWELAYQFISIAVELLPSKEEWKVQLYQSQLKLNNIQGVKLTTSASSIEETLIRKRLETEEPTSDLYIRLAALLHKQGKTWQEIDALKNAIKLYPNNSHTHIQLGKASERMKRYEDASLAYKIAIKLNSNKLDYDIFYRLGYCLEKINGNMTEINQAYDLAIKKDLESDSKKFGIGAIHERKGLWFDAINAYLKTFKARPNDSELCYRIGFSYQRCYDWKNAERYYLKALSINSDNSNWYYQVGFVKEKSELFLEATKYYELALKKRYVSYWYYRLGVCFTKSEKYQEATLAFLKSKRSFRVENIFHKKESYIKSSIIISLLKEELKFDVNKLDNWNKLGKLYFDQGDLKNAEFAYKQVLLRENEYNGETYYKYGLILAKQGKFELASNILMNCRQFQKLYGLSENKLNDDHFRHVAIYNEYYDALKIEKNTILFESFSGVAMSCNPLAIFLEMKNSSEFNHFIFIWVVNDINIVSDKYKKYENVVFIKKDSDKYLRYLCSAQYLVNNATFPPYFIRKEGQRYLNTWHGTPWKTLGKDIKNSFMELKNSQRNFLQTSHMLSPNPHTTWVLSDRYDIKEIYSGKMLEAGYPRIDLTLNTSQTRKAELYKILGIDPTKKVILYAPTWRGTLGSPEIESNKLINEIKELKSLDINFLFRGHYFVQENAYEEGVSQYIVPDFINTNELLSIIDILITDYSSIGFDYMATGKPIVYYIDDYEEYKTERGLYFDSDHLPGKMAKNILELKKFIIEEINYYKIHPLYSKAQQDFVPYEDGKVSARVIDWFINDSKYNNEIDLCNRNKKSLLIFGGEFLPNGITTSIINLLNNIDYNKYSVSLLIDPNAIAREEKRLAQFARVSPKVNIIPRVGRMNRSIEDDWIESKANQYKYLPNKMRSYLEKAYHKEFLRIVGNSKFDALIEFTGYSRFWAYLLGSAKIENVVKTIYQHNDKYGEWTLRFPHLENTFSIYYMFDHLMSVSKPTMELNIQNLANRFNLNREQFNYCDNVQDPVSIINKSTENLNNGDEKYFTNCKGKIFINLARLSPEKDQPKLIRSFSKVVDKYPNSRLLILGDGPLYNDLKALIKELHLEKNVYLLGIRFNPFPLLKRADCFVLSSNHEGQPMTLFEAMILEKPVISTDIVGSRSALEGRPGYLVENSESGLSKGMINFIEGKLSFEKFNYELYQDNALNMFYQKVLSKN